MPKSKFDDRGAKAKNAVDRHARFSFMAVDEQFRIGGGSYERHTGCGPIQARRYEVKERDPRVDPRPGDVLRKFQYWSKSHGGKIQHREVTVISVAHGAVRITSEPPFPQDANYFHHADWPYLMRNAEVLRTSNDKPTERITSPEATNQQHGGTK